VKRKISIEQINNDNENMPFEMILGNRFSYNNTDREIYDAKWLEAMVAKIVWLIIMIIQSRWKKCYFK
jgi:hypothetical protein